MIKDRWDAVVVGAGPNGLAAAIALRRAGLEVKLVEAKQTIGGGMRSAELTEPGFVHDVCSAVHPLAAESPFMRELPLRDYGLEWIEPPVSLAHPLGGEEAGVIVRSLEETARGLGEDGRAYLGLFEPFVREWERLAADLLGPIRFPAHPLAAARFGAKALRSAQSLAVSSFRGDEARALFAGLGAHSLQPLNGTATSAIALVLGILAHGTGWVIPRGGSQRIADAMGAYFRSLGGEIETGRPICSLDEISARAVLFDVTPRQLLEIARGRLSRFYRWQLGRYRYGPGVFKIDWALDGAIPFKNADCRRAGTVHLGGRIEEIVAAEATMARGVHSESPFVLLSQPSVFDPTRAPPGKHVAWAYCHVPNGSTRDMTDAIEDQVERFAPGFRDLIRVRHTMNCSQMEAYNANYVGGDINGGSQHFSQIFVRPALRISPYATSIKGVYLCSASTPPGGGVHGMCGFHAANHVLRSVFRTADS